MWAYHCGGFSWEWAIGQVAKVSWGSWDLEYKLNCCGSRAKLLYRMWALPRPGIELVAPALAGRSSTTGPPGKPFWCPLYPASLKRLTHYVSDSLTALIAMEVGTLQVEFPHWQHFNRLAFPLFALDLLFTEYAHAYLGAPTVLFLLTFYQA